MSITNGIFCGYIGGSGGSVASLSGWLAHNGSRNGSVVTSSGVLSAGFAGLRGVNVNSTTCVIAYRDGSGYPTLRQVTRSGKIPAFQTAANITTVSNSICGLLKHPSDGDKVIVAYSDSGVKIAVWPLSGTGFATPGTAITLTHNQGDTRQTLVQITGSTDMASFAYSTATGGTLSVSRITAAGNVLSETTGSVTGVGFIGTGNKFRVQFINSTRFVILVEDSTNRQLTLFSLSGAIPTRIQQITLGANASGETLDTLYVNTDSVSGNAAILMARNVSSTQKTLEIVQFDSSGDSITLLNNNNNFNLLSVSSSIGAIGAVNFANGNIGFFDHSQSTFAYTVLLSGFDNDSINAVQVQNNFVSSGIGFTVDGGAESPIYMIEGTSAYVWVVARQQIAGSGLVAMIITNEP